MRGLLTASLSPHGSWQLSAFLSPLLRSARPPTPPRDQPSLTPSSSPPAGTSNLTCFVKIKITLLNNAHLAAVCKHGNAKICQSFRKATGCSLNALPPSAVHSLHRPLYDILSNYRMERRHFKITLRFKILWCFTHCTHTQWKIRRINTIME